jgi:hypothetical protein
MSINVHIFDNHLNPSLVDHVNKFEINTDNSVFEIFFKEFISIYGTDSSQSKGLSLIYNSTGENYDNINKLDAKKVLLVIINHFLLLSDDKKKDLLDILAEQMADMYNTGQCSQGRTIRLIQILNYILT